jgi:hypothetical protein
VVGRSKRPFGQWNVDLPVEDSLESIQYTMQELITHLVRNEVQAFIERQEARRLTQILSPEQITEGILAGKVDLGERDFNQDVDVEEAIETALHAFQDGLYVVFVDRNQIDSLTDTFSLTDGTEVTFLRLVALAGG